VQLDTAGILGHEHGQQSGNDQRQNEKHASSSEELAQPIVAAPKLLQRELERRSHLPGGVAKHGSRLGNPRANFFPLALKPIPLIATIGLGEMHFQPQLISLLLEPTKQTVNFLTDVVHRNDPLCMDMVAIYRTPAKHALTQINN
jgi:hypothetical protein